MRRASIVVAALLLLGACGSTGLGDLGGILGSPSASQPSDISGTVSYVDSQQQRIDMNVYYVNQLRQSNTGSTSSIYYNSQTRVVYQGRDYRVSDLERGDEISVTGYNDNGRYLAQTITVTRNVRG